MEPINYLFVFFTALTGYALGVGLGYIAPEELLPGRKYFLFLEKVLFLFTFIPVIYFFKNSYLALLPVILVLLLLVIPFKFRAYLAFGVFLLWFFLIKSDNLVIILESSLIFLYGLPAGSLLLPPMAVSKLDQKVKVR